MNEWNKIYNAVLQRDRTALSHYHPSWLTSTEVLWYQSLTYSTGHLNYQIALETAYPKSEYISRESVHLHIKTELHIYAPFN